MQIGRACDALIRRWWSMLLIAAAVATAIVWNPTPVAAVDGWTLTSVCTPVERSVGFRSFLVTNDTGAPNDVVLRNLDTNQQVTVAAPVGDSFQLVPASSDENAANTTQLIVGGVEKDVQNADNRICAVVVGTAVCDPVTGSTTVTWTIKNNNDVPATIVNGGGQTFAPQPVAANDISTATETITGPIQPEDRSLSVTLDVGSGIVSTASDSVSLGACFAPAGAGFTLTKTASVDTAAVGDVITYTYVGTNTGTESVEVTRFVDDRLGLVVIEPSVDTTVPPGATITLTVSYTVRRTDAGTAIDNHVVVNVSPVDDPTDVSSYVAEASVDIAQVAAPVAPPASTVPPSTAATTTIATTTTVVGTATTYRVVVTLPATGSGNVTDAMIWIALVLVVGGLVTVRLTRRA